MRETFLPAVGEAADPPIVPAIIVRLARTLDDHTGSLAAPEHHLNDDRLYANFLDRITSLRNQR